MKTAALLEQIRETNLSYLLLAKQMINEDRAETLIRLGIDEQTADLLADLSTAQLLKVAQTNVPLCSLRFPDTQVWKLAADQGKDKTISGMHAAILMAGRSVQIGQ